MSLSTSADISGQTDYYTWRIHRKILTVFAAHFDYLPILQY